MYDYVVTLHRTDEPIPVTYSVVGCASVQQARQSAARRFAVEEMDDPDLANDDEWVFDGIARVPAGTAVTIIDPEDISTQGWDVAAANNKGN